MKKINYYLSLLLFSVIVNAQNIPVGENINLDQQLSNIDQSSVTSGIIYERTLQIADLYNFNQTTTFNTANYSYFKQAFLEMNKASNGSKFTTLQGLKNLTTNTNAPNQVDIAILNTQFHILNFNVDNQSLGGLIFDESTQKFKPIIGKTPFYMLHNTVIAPTKDYVTGSTITYKIRNDLFFNNGTKIIKTLVADFGDGINRIIINNQILTNQNFTINYSNSSEKTSKFIITYTDNTTLTTYGKIFLNYQNSSLPSVQNVSTACGIDDPLRQDFSLEADIPFTGYNSGDVPLKAKINYRIFYSNGNVQKLVKKPIIILDGFDPGDKRRIEDCDCEADITDCKARHTNKTTGLFDPALHKSMTDMMVYFDEGIPKNLLKELRSNGYDVILVNHPKYNTLNSTTNQVVEIDGGADYIERNSMALVKLIQQTNQLLANNGLMNNKISIVGPSMGGQISKYALAYMEKNNLPHNVKLWISVDSPHLGANVPMGDQALLNLVRGESAEANDFYFKDLRAPAAQQQLIEQHREGISLNAAYPLFSNTQFINNYNQVDLNYLNSEIIPQGLTQNRGNSFFQQHYNNHNNNGLPNSHGWPMNLRKIAIVNGSLTGSKETQLINGTPFYSYGNDSAMVLNIRGFQRVHINLPWPFGSITFRTHIASLESQLMPTYGSNSRISRFKKLFNDRTTQSPNINERGNMDNIPGGYYGAQSEISGSILATDPVPGTDLAIASTNWSFSFSNFSIENIVKSISQAIGGSEWSLRDYNPIHSFIPSFSALGHLQPNQNWGNPLNTNLACPSNKQTPFDSYFGLTKNTQHTSFTKESVTWLLKELAGQPQAPYFPIQENLLNGPTSICNTNTTYSFSDTCKLPSTVNWSVTPNLQIVSSTAYSVTVNQTSNGKGVITATFQNGQTINKTIWIGEPSFTFEYTYLDAQPIKSTLCVVSSDPSVTLEQQGVTNVTFTGSTMLYGNCIRTTAPLCKEATVTNACGSTTFKYDCDFLRIANNNIFKIFPNPSNDVVNIEIRDKNNLPEKGATISGELFDVLGISKSKVEIINNQATFSVRGLNKGIYILKIYINNQIENHQIAVE